MADKKVEKIVEESMRETIGVSPAEIEPVSSMPSVFGWLVHANDIVPPWWSRARDYKLWDFVVESNHMAIAVYNATVKVAGLTFKIRARDQNNPQHNRQAEELEYLYKTTPGFGAGWIPEYSKFLIDILTTDNGGFIEIIGEGDPEGPIIGMPISLRHWDSRRCTRTANPIYPVLISDDYGKQFKVHWTRIISMTQMPSSRREMNGVGLSAVSRSIMIAQTLNDIVTYKQERLGSRPHNQLLVGKGITGEEIRQAFRQVEETLSDRGHKRYSKTVAIGSRNTEISLERIDLSHMEPFEEDISINLGMYAIAAAFGMEADELWPTASGGGGGSQGAADLKRNRSRSRLPTQITGELASQFNFKVMPPHLEFSFDFKDDAEDQARALIRDIRSRNRERDLGTGALNVRTARLRMLEDGDIEREAFEEMELIDGRLPDGKAISILFYDPDPVYVRVLSFGGKDPLAVSTNDNDEMISAIETKRTELMKVWAASGSQSFQQRYRNAYHALDWLEGQYRLAAGESLPPVPQHQRRLQIDTRVDHNQQEEVEDPAQETEISQTESTRVTEKDWQE